MSKLKEIMKKLQENKEITVIDIETKNYHPERDGFWSETCNIIIAPNTSIFDAKKLQEFMMNLVPTLEPTQVSEFYSYPSELYFGKLFFDEDIGNERVIKIFTITDEDYRQRADFTMGELKRGKHIIDRTKSLRRRTWVNPYPCREIARSAKQGSNVYWINYNEYQCPNPCDVKSECPYIALRSLISRIKKAVS